jgi:hypothetical protein
MASPHEAYLSRQSPAWVIPSTRIQDATSGSSQRASNTLTALPGDLRRFPSISPDPDGTARRRCGLPCGLWRQQWANPSGPERGRGAIT